MNYCFEDSHHPTLTPNVADERRAVGTAAPLQG